MVGRRWSLLLLALVAGILDGCVCEPDHLVDQGYAPAKPYAAAIDACITKHDCDPLCLSMFALGPDQSLVSCAIENVDVQGTALVEMRSQDYGVCAAQDSGGGYYGDDSSTDSGDGGSTDTGDDGSCNDSSCGSDGSDDGSTDDGSSDDGSTDDGSTDTGDDGGDTGDDGGDTGDGGGDSGDGGDSSDWIYRPGSTPVKAPAIRATHVRISRIRA